MKLYSKSGNKILRQKWKIFIDVDIPKHSENKKKKKLCNYLKSIENDKAPRSDWLTKEFYEKFWKKLK